MDIKLIPDKYKETKKVSSRTGFSFDKFIEVGSSFLTRSNLLLAFSFVFLGIVIVGYLTLYGYRVGLIEQKESLDQEILVLNEQRNLETESNFIALKQGIESLKNVLKIKIYPSEIFGMLEELTLPQVRYSDFSIDFSEFILVLKTEAVDYSTLAKQVIVFNQDERIEDVALTEAGLNESGQAVSDLKLELDPSFLYSK